MSRVCPDCFGHGKEQVPNSNEVRACGGCNGYGVIGFATLADGFHLYRVMDGSRYLRHVNARDPAHARALVTYYDGAGIASGADFTEVSEGGIAA
jgi:hypothetical protein